jgi:hypothetical protein
MLSKEQLEDAAKCCENQYAEDGCLCKIYKVTGVSAVCVEVVAKTALSLMAERESMREMLKRVEFSGYDIDGIGSDAILGCCPVCHEEWSHKLDCALAAMIKGE